MSTGEMAMSKEKSCCNIRQRYILSLMCFFGLFMTYAMRNCLSIAITEMVDRPLKKTLVNDNYCTYNDSVTNANTSFHQDNVNHTNTRRETYDWSEHKQGVILSSFYWSYSLAQFFGGYITEKCGGKHTLGFGLLISAILTILTPAAVYIGDSTALISLRIIIGFVESPSAPATNALLATWIPLEERSRAVSFVYASVMVGTVFATVVSGWILQYSSIGWPLVFYVMGAFGILWYLIWIFLCYNSPQEHPFITQAETNYLEERMKEHLHKKPPPVPWRHLSVSKPLWALIIAYIGYGWIHFCMITDLPKYMSGVLKFSVEENGYLTSIVLMCTWIGANTTPWLVDYLISAKNISTTSVRKVGSVISMTFSAIFIVGASYAGCDRVLVITMFAISMACKGFAYPSIVSNVLDLSPNYAGTVMALSNGMAALTGILVPYIIGVFTPNQTVAEWRLVFWITVVIAVFCNLIFLVHGNGEVQYWNNPEFVEAERNKNVKQKIGNQKLNTTTNEANESLL